MLQIAQQTNEANSQTAQTYQEKINNILQVAQQGQSFELTDQDKQLAQSYAELLISDTGEIDGNILKQIPPQLMNEAIMQSAILKGAIPEQAEGVDYKFSNLGDGMVAVQNPQTGEMEFKQAP